MRFCEVFLVFVEKTKEKKERVMRGPSFFRGSQKGQRKSL